MLKTRRREGEERWGRGDGRERSAGDEETGGRGVLGTGRRD